MICLETTFLIDLWRERHDRSRPARRLLADHGTEVFVVPVTAAGEFLEGAAFISDHRLTESLEFLGLFELGAATMETAKTYANKVANLRRTNSLVGKSKADLWIAAWAIEHQSPLATRNIRHFDDIPRLELVSY